MYVCMNVCTVCMYVCGSSYMRFLLATYMFVLCSDMLPYHVCRDSLLTRLLQDSLGGSGRTIFIATIHHANVCIH